MIMKINRSKLYIIIIGVSTLAISWIHYTISTDLAPLHSIFMDLYYIPVLLGALIFGLRGAMITYTSVVFLYFPYIVIIWRIKTLFLAEDLLHTVFFGVFAFVAGFLVDRERRYRRQLEKDAYLAALGRTTAAIAHDLRNPLMVIAALAKRIKERKGNTESAIETIIKTAQNMHKIVDSTLDFAKPLQLSLQEEDIIEVIKNVLDLCQTKAERHGINISVNLSPEPLHIAIDIFHIERALMNLIDNAIDASVRNGTIVITAYPGKEYIIIRIKDQGSGMTLETIENIFMPFYTTKTNGTGIGMAITKKIIDHHLGIIDIDSKPGRGTEITIELPYQLLHKR
jgi:two-component system, NtrC family, sensor histidine kinase HydH